LTGIPLGGLFYPMAIASIGVVVSLGFLRQPYHEQTLVRSAGFRTD
jgi:hypothetical protein